MNYIKLFVTVFAMALALNASAQSKTTAKSKTAAPAKTTTTAAPKKTTTTTTARTTSANDRPSATRSSNKGYDPDVHFMLETRIGSGLGENLVLEKEFHKYVAVDFFSLGYTMHTNKPNAESLSRYENFGIESYSTGNPLLQPSYSHNVDASWNKYFEKFGSVGVSATYRAEADKRGKLHISEVGSFEVVSCKDGICTYRVSMLPERTGMYQVCMRFFAKNPLLPHRQSFECVKWL